MNVIDKKILRLIDLLIFENKVKNITEFCGEINVLPQTLSKIKKQESHFTVKQIERICKVFNVNANWIFCGDLKVYKFSESIEITVD